MQNLERGTIPASFGAMGYHHQSISEVRNSHSSSKYEASVARSVRRMDVPDTGDSSGSHSSHGQQPVASASLPVLSESAPTTRNLPPEMKGVSTREGRLITAQEGQQRLPSSLARKQSQLLRKNFVAAEVDFDAIADSSVGGNGLPRPYGRFIAARDGHGLAMWQRVPAMRGDRDRIPGPPEITEAPPDARNITKINIQRHQLDKRNIRPDIKFNNRFKSKGDKITNLPHRLLMIELEARKRPFHEGLGRDYYASRFYNRESGRINLPAASFLSSRPRLPPNVRVDCGIESTHEHLASELPPPGGEWQNPSILDSTDLPKYQGTVIRKDGSILNVSRPLANREKILHPAVMEYQPPMLEMYPMWEEQGLGPTSLPQFLPSLPVTPLVDAPMDSGPGSTFITQ